MKSLRSGVGRSWWGIGLGASGVALWGASGSLAWGQSTPPGTLPRVVRWDQLPPGTVVPMNPMNPINPVNPGAPGGTPPAEPERLPANLPGTAPVTGSPALPGPVRTTPQPETFLPLDAEALTVRSQGSDWHLMFAGRSLANFEKQNHQAEQARLILRKLNPTHWASLGTIGLYYGLRNQQPILVNPWDYPSVPIDLASIRAESVRGVWVLKDQQSIFANFGLDRATAEQAAAVIQKYGYNRLGFLGRPDQGPFRYLFAMPNNGKTEKENPLSALQLAAAEQNLAVTGIPVPGAGFIGERFSIDARKLDVKKIRADYVLMSGGETLQNFGPSEWAARDAARLIQDQRFTEFCRVGETTFFLIQGKPPTRVPFNAQSRSFDPKSVQARAYDGRFGIFDGTGRPILSCATATEAQQMVQVIRGFGFDTVCQLGLSSRTAFRFLAKTSVSK